MKTKIYFIGIALAGMWLLSGCHAKEEMSYSADPVTNIEGLWQIIFLMPKRRSDPGTLILPTVSRKLSAPVGLKTRRSSSSG